MTTHIFADWHNIRLGAQGASNDWGYQINTNNLFYLIARDRTIVYSRNVYGANIDKIYFDHKLWTVNSFDPSPFTGKEKEVDTQMTVDIMKLLNSCNPADTNITLLSGDLDFKPVIQEILNKALNTKMKTLHAPNYLDGHLNYLSFKKSQRIPVKDYRASFFDEDQTPGRA